MDQVAWQADIEVPCVLIFRIFVGLTTFSTLEHGTLVSVWTNYSGLPTDPGSSPDE
jgi:hypothetical protein